MLDSVTRLFSAPALGAHQSPPPAPPQAPSKAVCQRLCIVSPAVSPPTTLSLIITCRIFENIDYNRMHNKLIKVQQPQLHDVI